MVSAMGKNKLTRINLKAKFKPYRINLLKTKNTERVCVIFKANKVLMTIFSTNVGSHSTSEHHAFAVRTKCLKKQHEVNVYEYHLVTYIVTLPIVYQNIVLYTKFIFVPRYQVSDFFLCDLNIIC